MSAFRSVPTPLLDLERAWAVRDEDPVLARHLALTFRPAAPAPPQVDVVLAYLEWRDGNLPASLHRSHQAIRDLQREPLSAWHGRAVNTLACLESRLNRPDQAVRLYDEQIRVARQVQDDELEASGQHDLGVELRASDPDRAREHVLTALQRFRQLGYGFGVAIALTNLAQFAQDAGQHEQALAYLEEALTYPGLQHRPEVEAEAVHTTLLSLDALGRTTRVPELEARLAALAAQNPGSELRIDVALALTRHGDPHLALRLLPPEVEFARSLGTHVSLPRLHEALSRAHAELGHDHDALLHLRATLDFERATHASERRKVYRSLEVLHRIQALEEAAENERRQSAALQEHVRELQALNDRIRELSRTDGLTGLSNRDHLFLRGETLALNATPDAPLGVAIIDIDHFKAVNDTYGHPFGDTVLRRLAGLLREHAAPQDVIARYGGEEFVLLRPAEAAEDLARTAQHVADAIRNLTWPDVPHPFRVTVSIGVAQATTPDFELALATADRHLYHVKHTGRDGVAWYI